MSNGIRDLLTGLQQFKSGVKEFALQRALSHADEARQEIQRSEMDEKEKLSEMRQVSDRLVGAMTALQATPESIEAATKPFGTEEDDIKISGVQSLGQALSLAMQDPQKYGHLAEGFRKAHELKATTKAKAQEDLIESRERIAETKAKAARAKRIDSTMARFQRDFSKRAEKIDEATTQARNAIALVDSDNPLTPGAIGTMMARASSEVGNLTDTERKAYQGSLALLKRMERSGKVMLFSELPKEDKKAIKGLANIFLEGGSLTLKNTVNRLAGQAQSLSIFQDVPKDQLVKEISGGTIDFEADRVDAEKKKTKKAKAQKYFGKR